MKFSSNMINIGGCNLESASIDNSFCKTFILELSKFLKYLGFTQMVACRLYLINLGCWTVTSLCLSCVFHDIIVWFLGWLIILEFPCEQYAITQLNRLEDNIQERWTRKKHDNFNISMYLYFLFFSFHWYLSYQVNYFPQVFNI